MIKYVFYNKFNSIKLIFILIFHSKHSNTQKYVIKIKIKILKNVMNIK